MWYCTFLRWRIGNWIVNKLSHEDDGDCGHKFESDFAIAFLLHITFGGGFAEKGKLSILYLGESGGCLWKSWRKAWAKEISNQFDSSYSERHLLALLPTEPFSQQQLYSSSSSWNISRSLVPLLLCWMESPSLWRMLAVYIYVYKCRREIISPLSIHAGWGCWLAGFSFNYWWYGADDAKRKVLSLPESSRNVRNESNTARSRYCGPCVPSFVFSFSSASSFAELVNHLEFF